MKLYFNDQKMDEEIDWAVKKYLHDDFSVLSETASPKQIQSALYKARNPEKQPIVQAILRGDVLLVHRFLQRRTTRNRKYPETITEAMVLLALQYLPEVAVDLVIQLFTTWPYHSSEVFIIATNAAINEEFGYKELRDVNELLWKTKDVKNLRILASTISVGTLYGNLLLFTDSATVEIYDQIRDNIHYSEPDSYLLFLNNAALDAPIDVFWAVYKDVKDLFSTDDIQTNVIPTLMKNFDRISQKRREIIDYFVNIEYMEDISIYFDSYEDESLDTLRYLLNLLDFGEYRDQLLEMRQYLLAQNNEHASNIAMFIGPTMLAS